MNTLKNWKSKITFQRAEVVTTPSTYYIQTVTSYVQHLHCWIQLNTVEPRYNEGLGTMKITLLYQVSHYIRVKKRRNIKSWDQQNYLVIKLEGFVISDLFITRFHCIMLNDNLTCRLSGYSSALLSVDLAFKFYHVI